MSLEFHYLTQYSLYGAVSLNNNNNILFTNLLSFVNYAPSQDSVVGVAMGYGLN
jgi:hypothetical protein